MQALAIIGIAPTKNRPLLGWIDHLDVRRLDLPSKRYPTIEEARREKTHRRVGIVKGLPI